MDLGRPGIRRRRQPGSSSGTEPRTVGSKTGGERLEEGDAGADFQLGIAGEDFAGERHAGRFATAREQVFAELDQAFRALLGELASIAGALDQRAATLRDGLQHIAKEGGGVHGFPSLA